MQLEHGTKKEQMVHQRADITGLFQCIFSSFLVHLSLEVLDNKNSIGQNCKYRKDKNSKIHKVICGGLMVSLHKELAWPLKTSFVCSEEGYSLSLIVHGRV